MRSPMPGTRPTRTPEYARRCRDATIFDDQSIEVWLRPTESEGLVDLMVGKTRLAQARLDPQHWATLSSLFEEQTVSTGTLDADLEDGVGAQLSYVIIRETD